MAKIAQYASIETPPLKRIHRITNTRILAAGLLAALTTGAPTYAFGLYGETLMQTLGLSQSQLDTIAASGFAAGLISWLPGMMVDQWGPRLIMGAGGCLMSAMLFVDWLLSRQIVIVGHDWIVLALSSVGFLIFVGNSLVIGSLFKSLVLSCSQGRGSAVGAAKAYVGLGAGVYSSLFGAFRHQSDLDFLFLTSVFSILCIALPGIILLPTKQHMSHVVDVTTSKHFQVIYVGVAVLAITVLGSSVLSIFQPLSGSADLAGGLEEQNITRGIFLLLAWFGPIAVLFLLDPTRDLSGSESIDEDKTLVDDPAGRERADAPHEASSLSPSPARLNRASSILVEDLSLTQMLMHPTAWLFLCTCTILVGSGTMMTNNMGQMVESLLFPPDAAAACLSIFSVSQAFSRAATGFIADALWQRFQVPRTLLVVVATVFGMLGHLMLAVSDDRVSFVAGVLLAGIAFGMIWPLMVLIVGDLYGKRCHGANYMFYDGFASAVGTFLVAKCITQTVYESNIQGDNGGNKCHGKSCFALSHFIVTFLCGLSFVFSTISYYLTRHYFRATNG